MRGATRRLPNRSRSSPHDRARPNPRRRHCGQDRVGSRLCVRQGPAILARSGSLKRAPRWRRCFPNPEARSVLSSHHRSVRFPRSRRRCRLTLPSGSPISKGVGPRYHQPIKPESQGNSGPTSQPNRSPQMGPIFRADFFWMEPFFCTHIPWNGTQETRHTAIHEAGHAVTHVGY
jgi:hypothetical protein